MTPFKFRLAAVLRYRQRLLEEKQGEMQQLHAARRRLEDEIGALDAEAARSEAAMNQFVGQIISVIELRLSSDHGQLLRRRIRDKRERLAPLDEQIAAKRNELVEARRQVKSLEQLRERRASRHRKEVDIEEQKFADETSQRKFSISFARKKLP